MGGGATEGTYDAAELLWGGGAAALGRAGCEDGEAHPGCGLCGGGVGWPTTAALPGWGFMGSVEDPSEGAGGRNEWRWQDHTTT